MPKILIIKSCLHCPKRHHSWYCVEADRQISHRENQSNTLVPDWCPLNDAPDTQPIPEVPSWMQNIEEKPV